jgi:hypothetical protein
MLQSHKHARFKELTMAQRTFTLLVVLALLTGGLAGASAQEQQLDDETVMEAAGTIFSLYLYGATGMQYGQIPEGISYDEEAQRFRYEEVDLTGLSDSYTRATGTIIREAENTLQFDFTLTGGPVSTITYRIARDTDDPAARSKPTDIVVNGKPYRFSTAAQD